MNRSRLHDESCRFVMPLCTVSENSTFFARPRGRGGMPKIVSDCFGEDYDFPFASTRPLRSGGLALPCTHRPIMSQKERSPASRLLS